jgi:hypothetical protein
MSSINVLKLYECYCTICEHVSFVTAVTEWKIENVLDRFFKIQSLCVCGRLLSNLCMLLLYTGVQYSPTLIQLYLSFLTHSDIRWT